MHQRLSEYPTSASEDDELLNRWGGESQLGHGVPPAEREPAGGTTPRAAQEALVTSEDAQQAAQGRMRMECAIRIRRGEKRILERWARQLAPDADGATGSGPASGAQSARAHGMSREPPAKSLHDEL